MLVQWWYLNGSYQHTVQCMKGVERKQRKLVAEEDRAVTSRVFIAYGHPLEMMNSFRYLGRVITIGR